ncbi:hypothetical protein CHLNCDRAFT_51929 [Chlorella variabilis]|uniref:Expansin-like EG45 domain-containing protein n=1 Tax=Chlorella variabilis TaxID=554065 RepID=E1ZCJ3_CHLVA|nr:hypothetical protein CHLNCDRAFT_51929 [Chlorella variabilis]EFN56252.1 hypothetical protein CHLNCDRAFT_51929 [Chlorella variabilis]|eukprot:XP_005848354.1 hypothetical protein CHLNCDRAFT_51929 [Chlorella variabilis]
MLSSRPTAVLCSLLLLLAVAGQAQAASRARFLGQKQQGSAPSSEQSVGGPAAEPNVTAFDGQHSFGLGAVAAAAASAATGAGPVPWLPSVLFSGDGTAFSEAVPNTGKGFACSYRYLNDWASTHFAAINRPMWENGDACARCLTAWCVDERCATRNKRVQVMVTDLCPECKEGDVDFSIPVYRDITGMWPHRLAIQWEWSDCSSNIEGDIHLAPKDGINAQWQAFYFSNAKYPLKSVTLNGKPLDRNEFQFWVHAAPLADGPAEFVFEAVNGKKVKGRCDNPHKEQSLPNFD